MKTCVLSIAAASLVLAALSDVQAARPTPDPIPVQVTNSSASPVPVTVVQPVAQSEQQVNICGESQLGFPGKFLYSVPAGKRLEIDFASVKASRFLDDGEALYVEVRTTVQGIEGSFLAGSVRGVKGFEDSRSVKIYADPATTVTTAQGSSTTGGLVIGTICLSGRLLPI